MIGLAAIADAKPLVDDGSAGRAVADRRIGPSVIEVVARHLPLR
jgi:hypothetical protein